jgi:thiol-disulfide isomerase/thioredoxin
LVEIKAVHVVHAIWCPHCHPATVEPIKEASEERGIPFFSYDIDVPEQERKADELVRSFGDWSEDYLIPQVFVEMSDGEMRHIFTGFPGGIASTKRSVNDLLTSPLFTTAGKHNKRQDADISNALV